MSADYKYPFLNNSTTCFNQIKKYGHYLFGLYEEDGDINTIFMEYQVNLQRKNILLRELQDLIFGLNLWIIWDIGYYI